MKIIASNSEEYVAQLPEERKVPMQTLREVIKKNLPEGFEETMSYDMIAFVVPHSIYPAGYRANPKEPLPLLYLGSQKNYIAIYHMGLYGNPKLLAWFQEEYAKYAKRKLDMGKSCIRLKDMEDIPYELIGKLCREISLEDYLKLNQTI